MSRKHIPSYRHRKAGNRAVLLPWHAGKPRRVRSAHCRMACQRSPTAGARPVCGTVHRRARRTVLGVCQGVLPAQRQTDERVGLYAGRTAASESLLRHDVRTCPDVVRESVHTLVRSTVGQIEACVESGSTLFRLVARCVPAEKPSNGFVIGFPGI